MNASDIRNATYVKRATHHYTLDLNLIHRQRVIEILESEYLHSYRQGPTVYVCIQGGEGGEAPIQFRCGLHAKRKGGGPECKIAYVLMDGSIGDLLANIKARNVFDKSVN